MADAEMPIFTRTFDFLTWLLPATNHFPRAHRHTFTQRLLAAAFDLRKGPARIERLQLADEALSRVRVYLRLAWRWQWLSSGQYEHVAAMVAEIGRLLGGWRIDASVKGWINHVRYANTIGLRKSIFRRHTL